VPEKLIAQFERLIRRDPARRGLISSEAEHGPLCGGHLLNAAKHLAQHATHVGIVTGFYIPQGTPPAAETDGPLGAFLLAQAFQLAGIETCVITDEYCASAVRQTANAVDYPEENLLSYPQANDRWIPEFFTGGPGKQITHLISVERVGPSHTPESLRNQERNTAPPLNQFADLVPESSHNRCHNMRGEIIDEQTADMHRLFEELPAHHPNAKTIGIGDGGNEIGMGSVPWEELHVRLTSEQAHKIPCRISTDWNIIAGTSNWGAYALAAATLLLKGQTKKLKLFNSSQQLQVLKHLVEYGPAVDGVTRRQEATVDGLPFLTYIQPWEGIRRLLELGD